MATIADLTIPCRHRRFRRAGGSDRIAHNPPVISRRRRLAIGLASLFPIGLLILAVVHFLVPQRTGVLALAVILAPQLFLLLGLLVPLALGQGAALLRRALAACLVVAVLWFGRGLLSFPSALPAGAIELRALSWNLQQGTRTAQLVAAVVDANQPAVVAIQELTFVHRDLIESEPRLTARLPHRILRPEGDSTGMGLLSALPIRDSGSVRDPPLIWARLELPDARLLTVVNAHPLPAAFRTVTQLRLPLGFDPTARDRSLQVVRQIVDDGLARGPVLLLGDLNVTEREPAYQVLAQGLVDAQIAAGSGFGLTWRPNPLKGLPVGLLRIDYAFVSPDLVALDARPDCTPRGSDHCVLHVRVAVRGPP